MADFIRFIPRTLTYATDSLLRYSKYSMAYSPVSIEHLSCLYEIFKKFAGGLVAELGAQEGSTPGVEAQVRAVKPDLLNAGSEDAPYP